MESFLKKYAWEKIEAKVNSIKKELSEIKNDNRKSGELRKELAFLESFLCLYSQIKEIDKERKGLLQELLEIDDPQMQELIKEEEANYNKRIEELKVKIVDQSYVLPNSSHDSKSAFIEIRSGAGGSEASLFVADISRMYTMYAQKRGWHISVTDSSPTGVGGFREIVLFIEGKNAFQYFSHESGVHRVQRVPETESQGRVHTSTITVAVLPEVQEVEVSIDEKDLRIDTYRAGGAGGQHVNKTDSAVRITHIPSGIVVQCQDERSQHKNKAKAMKALKSKLFVLEEERQKAEQAKKRRDMVSTADRSEKIRTYNYPQNRVTDHRVGLTLNQLNFIIDGNMDGLLSELLKSNQDTKIVNPYLEGYVLS